VAGMHASCGMARCRLMPHHSGRAWPPPFHSCNQYLSKVIESKKDVCSRRKILYVRSNSFASFFESLYVQAESTPSPVLHQELDFSRGSTMSCMSSGGDVDRQEESLSPPLRHSVFASPRWRMRCRCSAMRSPTRRW
jgi:hypothetical protein